MHSLAVNRTRLLNQIEELAAINRLSDSSCCRLALTDADRRGRDLVVSWMREAGLDIQIDQIGNIIGVLRGSDDGPPVMTGSHIDTVATGGRFDGAYGVIAGLEALRVLREASRKLRRALAVAVFTNEEGVRFQPDMMGSLVFAGGMPLAEALACRAHDGVSVGEELQRIGYAGEAPCGAFRPRAYIELHIEQGPILDSEGGVLGAVQDLQGISWQELTIRGASNHAGTTPMQLRRDAAYCAACVAVFVRELAARVGGSQVATVGSIRLAPNLVNVIAREAKLTIDLRNTDDLRLAAAERELSAFLGELSDREGVSVELRRLVRTPPVRFDEGLVQTIERIATEMGHPNIPRMTSGAGHDAQMIARICPAAMIFVPSIAGISHNPAELTEPDHLELGANVLLRVLERVAND